MGNFSVRLAIVLGLIILTGCHSAVPWENSRIIGGANEDVCLDQGTQLMWQVSWSRRQFSSAEEAEAYVHQLHIGGYSDWRLPTKRELYDLHEIMDRSVKSDCKIQLHGNYWMKNEGGTYGAGNWEIYPLCGSVRYRFNKNPGSKAKVRAVRDAATR